MALSRLVAYPGDGFEPVTHRARIPSLDSGGPLLSHNQRPSQYADDPSASDSKLLCRTASQHTVALAYRLSRPGRLFLDGLRARIQDRWPANNDYAIPC